MFFLTQFIIFQRNFQPKSSVSLENIISSILTTFYHSVKRKFLTVPTTICHQKVLFFSFSKLFESSKKVKKVNFFVFTIQKSFFSEKLVFLTFATTICVLSVQIFKNHVLIPFDLIKNDRFSSLFIIR